MYEILRESEVMVPIFLRVPQSAFVSSPVRDSAQQMVQHWIGGAAGDAQLRRHMLFQ